MVTTNSERKPPLVCNGDLCLCQSCECRKAEVTVRLQLRLGLFQESTDCLRELEWVLCRECANGERLEVHVDCAGMGHGRVLK
jgi:hypothetical protein